MRNFRAAAIIALLAGPAYAQSPDQHVPRYGETTTAQTPEQIEARKRTEKAYEHSLGNIPDKGPVDPWGNARSADAPREPAKTATKAAPAKKRTKTGSAANSKTGSAAN